MSRKLSVNFLPATHVLSFLRLPDSRVSLRAVFVCVLRVPKPRIRGESLVCMLFKCWRTPDVISRLAACFNKPSYCGTVFRWNKPLPILQTAHENSLLLVPLCDFTQPDRGCGGFCSGHPAVSLPVPAYCYLPLKLNMIGFILLKKALWVCVYDFACFFLFFIFLFVKYLWVTYWFFFIQILLLIWEEKKKSPGGKPKTIKETSKQKKAKKKKKSKPLHNWEKIKQRDALVCVISSFWNENLAFCAITPKVSPRFASLLVEKEIRLVCCSPLPDPAWSVSCKCIWKWCPQHFCLWLKIWEEKRQGGESLIRSLFFQFIHV